MTCSCGETKAHVVARRETYDGKHVLLWEDGSLTWALGYTVRGSARPKTDEQRALARRAGWLVLGEACVWRAEELPELVSAARAVARRGGSPGDVRALVRARREQRAALRPVWEVYEADRDGRPLVRVWRLPRLSHPGLVVWDDARGTGARGRYQVLSVGRARGPDGGVERETLYTTGPQFETLRELRAYLESVSALNHGGAA